MRAVLDFAGSTRRQNDLFGGTALEMTKRFIKGLKGVENIYTQHEPYITQLIDSVSKNRLSEVAYPYVLQPTKLDFKLANLTLAEEIYFESRFLKERSFVTLRKRKFEILLKLVCIVLNPGLLKWSTQYFLFYWHVFFSGRVESLLIFIIGGATYEESRAVCVANERRRTSPSSPNIVLLTTSMLNTTR